MDRQSAIPRQVGSCMLWFASVHWDAMQGTDRRLVEAMPEPVVWVDSPSSPLRRGGRWLPATWGGVKVVRTDPPLVRIATATLPFSTRRGIRTITPSLRRRQVRAALDVMGARPHTVVLSNLDELFGFWGDDVVELLLGTDDYVKGAQLMGIQESRLVRLEEIAVRRANVVLAVSEELAAKWRALGATPIVLPNGCTTIPEELLSDSGEGMLPRIGGSPAVAGLVGHLSSRIDMDLLEALARSGMRLLLVGPKDPRWEPARFAELIGRQSVDFVGRVSAESLPFYFRQMDVAITPYDDSEFNRSSFPLKTLEYLGAGLPVVTSDLPASRWVEKDMAEQLGEEAVRRHLAVTNSVPQFVAQVHRLANSRSRELDRERWNFATRHSWSRRADTLCAIAERARSGLL